MTLNNIKKEKLFKNNQWITMESLDKCPICGKRLELQQIDFKTAVFICLDVKCPYPYYGDCMVVQRNIENINKPVDLCAQLIKQQGCPSRLSTSTTNEQYSESLLADLEKLLDSQSPVMNNIQETVEKQPESLVQTINTESNAQNNQSLEIAELDEFLSNLLT